jgi:hypothetical protein
MGGGNGNGNGNGRSRSASTARRRFSQQNDRRKQTKRDKAQLLTRKRGMPGLRPAAI